MGSCRVFVAMVCQTASNHLPPSESILNRQQLSKWPKRGFNVYNVGASCRSRQYPRKADIQRAITTVRACGLNIACIEIGPDGSIRLSEAVVVQFSPLSDFDRLDAEGLL